MMHPPCISLTLIYYTRPDLDTAEKAQLVLSWGILNFPNRWSCDCKIRDLFRKMTSRMLDIQQHNSLVSLIFFNDIIWFSPMQGSKRVKSGPGRGQKFTFFLAYSTGLYHVHLLKEAGHLAVIFGVFGRPDTSEHTYR